MKPNVLLTSFLTMIFALVGCNGSMTSAGKAGKLVADCAESGLVGAKRIRYTGPMPISEGQIYVRLADDLILPGPTAVTMFGDPLPKNLLLEAQGKADCSQTTKRSTNLKLELGATVKTLPVSGQLKTDLSKGEITSVTVDGFEWRFVDILEYSNQIAKLPEQGSVRQAIAKGNIEAVIGALRVSNYRAEVDLSKSGDTSLIAKYSGPLPGGLSGDLAPGVTYSSSGAGKVVLLIPGTSYVAGVFRPMGVGGQVESGAAPQGGGVAQVSIVETVIQTSR